jgi:hypothetical protein
VAAVVLLAAAPAVAQQGSSSAARRNTNTGDHDGAGDFYRMIRDVITSMTGGTRGKLLDFFETVELWDAEAELDRLVGNPWELHDSTDYKLRLLPLRLAFPTYGRLTDQMTGLDDRRGLRIQNLGVDEVDQLAVTFAPSPDVGLQDLTGSLLGSFSVREFADLSIFTLSHQPFFPQTEEGWHDLEHRLARGKVAVLGSVIGVGALFNAGSFSTSGGIAGSARSGFGLGWYGGIRRLGMQLSPQLRGGLTTRAPGVEMAIGLREQIRPSSDERRRSIEVAVREGWLNRLSRPTGWDAFLEGALRQVIAAEPQYRDERLTGRLGIFARREGTPGVGHLVFRQSAELESDFTSSARFVFGVGLEHPHSGLTTLVQTSRTAVVTEQGRTHENRVGLFVAGTVEPPNRSFLDAMHASARAVREQWEAVRQSPLAEQELRVAALASALASYLEARQVAYSLLHWDRSPGDVHGPLDAEILLAARHLVSTEFEELAARLQELSRRLQASSRRVDELRDSLMRERDAPRLAEAYQAELDAVERVRRQEAERASDTLAAYRHYRTEMARIAATTASARTELDPVPPVELRRLAALSTPPLF